jgi:hypothetical protein
MKFCIIEVRDWDQKIKLYRDQKKIIGTGTGTGTKKADSAHIYYRHHDRSENKQMTNDNEEAFEIVLPHKYSTFSKFQP